MERGKTMKMPFRLYQEKDLFKSSKQERRKLIKQNLIEHSHDEDIDTDEEIVDKHI